MNEKTETNPLESASREPEGIPKRTLLGLDFTGFLYLVIFGLCLVIAYFEFFALPTYVQDAGKLCQMYCEGQAKEQPLGLSAEFAYSLGRCTCRYMAVSKGFNISTNLTSPTT